MSSILNCRYISEAIDCERSKCLHVQWRYLPLPVQTALLSKTIYREELEKKKELEPGLELELCVIMKRYYRRNVAIR